MSTYNIEMNLLNSSSSCDTLYPKVNLSNSQGTLPASQISSGTFGVGDYTIPGNLTLKGNGNFGTKLNLGDGDYVHISEPTDDCLEIKGKKINFVTTDTSSSGLTWNENAIGGNSDSALIEYSTRIGTGTNISTGFTFCTLTHITHPVFMFYGNNNAQFNYNFLTSTNISTLRYVYRLESIFEFGMIIYFNDIGSHLTYYLSTTSSDSSSKDIKYKNGNIQVTSSYSNEVSNAQGNKASTTYQCIVIGY